MTAVASTVVGLAACGCCRDAPQTRLPILRVTYRLQAHALSSYLITSNKSSLHCLLSVLSAFTIVLEASWLHYKNYL